MKNKINVKSIFLLLAFLLSVGQMWGAQTYFYSGEGNGKNWTKQAMTVSTDGFYEYYQVTSSTTHKFKIGTSSNQWAYNYSYVNSGYHCTNVTEIGDYGSDNCYCWKGSTHYILVYYPSTAVNSTANPIICASTTLPRDYAITVATASSAQGTVSPASGYATSSSSCGLSISASPKANYAFVNWTVTSGTASFVSSTSASTTVSASAASTITANFAPQWNIKGSGTEMGNWGTYNQLVYVSSNTFRGTITLAANTTYDFKVVDRRNNRYYGYGTSSDGTYSFVGQTTASEALSYGDSYKNLRIMTAGAGTYTFEWNSSTNKLTVTYPTVTHPSSDYIYYKNTKNWTNVYAYLYGGTVNIWTGPKLSSFTFDGVTYYYAALGDNTNIIFNQGNGTNQDDLTSITGNKGKYYDPSATSWKPFTLTVTLNNKSATSAGTESVTATYKDNTALSSNITCPGKTGYTFGGYYTTDGGSTQIITAAGAWVASVSGYTDASKNWIKNTSTTIYAKWTANQYAVTLDRQGASDGSANVTATYGSGMPAATMPTRTGYTFGGYYTEVGGSGTQYYTDGGASARTWNIASATTLYAKWTAHTTTVTIKANGGAQEDQTTTATYDSNSLTSFTKVTKAGSGLDGYYTASSGGTKVLDANGNPVASASDASYTYTDASGNWQFTGSTLTLHAQWLSNVSVTYYGNGNTGGSVPVDANSYVPDGAHSATVLGNTGSLVRTGYTWSCWNTLANGLGVDYSAGASINPITSNVSLFAKWTGNNYTVTLNKQGGSGGPESVTATYGSDMPSTTMPTKTGYDFQGYFASAGGSGTKYYNSDGSSNHVWDVANSSTSIHAHWTVHNYTVSYYPSSAPSGCTYSVKPTTADYNTTVNVTIAPDDTWHHVGVTVEKAGGGTVEVTQVGNVFSFTQPAANVTVNVTVTDLHTGVYMPNNHNEWHTSDPDYEFKKVVGSSPAAATISVDINKEDYSGNNYYFGGLNIYNSGSWWKNDGSNLTYMTSHDHTDWGFNTTTGDKSTFVDLPVSGTYTFTLTNYTNTGSQALSVTYPDKSFIEGNFATAWDEDAYPLVEDGNIQSVTIPITSLNDVQFRLVSHGQLWGTTTKILKASNSQTLSGKKMTESGGVMTIGAYVAGDYTFSYNKSTHVLTVTWPVINQLQIYGSTPSGDAAIGNYNWDSHVGNVYSKTLTLTGGTSYTFKVVKNSDFYGNGGTASRNSSTSSNTLSDLASPGSDMTIVADYSGNYTFNYDASANSIAITYPTAYQITWGMGSVPGNKYTITCKKYGTETAVVSNSTWIKSGDKVTFYAGNNDAANVAKDGYTWRGYYGDAAGATDQLSSTTGWSPTINAANMSFYACFYENDYWISPYINGQGSISPNGANAHIATTTSFTANPGTGYKFDSWEERGGSAMIIASPSVATTNVTTTAAATLQANFSPQWSVLGSGAFGGWEAFDAHLFDNYAVVSSKNVGYNTITLAANTNYEIKVYDRQTSTWYGGSANQNITYGTSGSGNEYTIATTSSPKSVFIQSAAGGSYTLNWNLTDKKIAVVYPTSRYITTGVNDALGGSFTAVDNSSNNVYGGKFVANNATVTFTATPNTGYNFAGWYSDASCETAYVNGTGGAAISGEGGVVLTLSSITSDMTVYAKFTPKTYTVTLTRSGDGYGSGGDATATATFNATLPAVTLPTAANGYAFMGYYSGENGTGTQFMNASGTWATSVPDTISSSKWVLDAGATLYAYFKKAEVTAITFSPAAVVEPNATITATPTIAPTPTGDHLVCWELQYSNGTPLASQPTFTPGASNSVSFTAPSASATYRLQAILRTGTSCSGGDILSTYVDRFQVAGEHDVTVLYKDASGNTIKTSEVIEGVKPLVWSSDITAPTITGYTFARWDAGDGVSIKNGESDPVVTSTDATINIKANYDGTLTAVYSKKRLIFFNNTLNWDTVVVYFYKNNSYWGGSNQGTGANTGWQFTSYPYSEGKHGGMQRVAPGSNIWYFDAEAAGVNASYVTVAFTDKDQHGCDYFYDNAKVIRRDDYNSTQLSMFVPIDQEGTSMNGGTAKYFNDGYWMNYPESTGYTLKIYDNVDAAKETGAIRSIAFPYSEDLKLPLKLDVEFNDGNNHDYWFMVYRNDGTYLGSAYHFKQGYQNEQVISGGNNKNKITTSAPGNYKFILTYHDNGSGTVNYYIDVDFPIATGDYRIYYSDNATWSKGAHTKNSWYHPSHSIAKATTEAKKDTVSFYIPKGEGISHTMKFQKVSVTNEGVVTWSDVAGGSITIPSSITESGVYNFIFSQPAGGTSISLEKVEPYTGNYYIRTDCAGNTKWDSYKNVDHQMTYSDYSATNKGFTHYYAHWAESGTNVKFTIANDYSLCVTDTLEGDTYTDDAQTLPAGANVRFMWKQSTNKISRAYISGSSVISDRFLVLEGDAKMFAENGDPLTDAGGGKISGLNDNEVNLVDDQNFIYERSIQVQTTARARLSAKYNNKVQYFIGNDSGDTWAAKTEELLGGESSATKHTMRIVYDFKTDRLVKAYVPAANLEDNIAINADIMLVREHQEEGQQLTFNGGSLSEVLTVYGVMRFNRWTLNNKEKTGGHAVVGDPKSSYERGMYWISFPFDVNLSDVFGFGTYGVDWIIEEYQGDKRATDGYWADSEGFWEFVMNRTNYVLEAGKGYVLALDLDRMKDNNTDFWSNNIEQVELYFPSATNVSSISATNVRTTVPSHECTIDRRTDKASPDINKDRTIADSHWNLIGIPSYANYGSTLTSDGSTVVTWNNPASQNLPYLYEWNMTDNSYTPQTGTTYPFKSMHGYMVQYHGYLYWTLASATPASPVVARRTYAEKPQNVELRLEIQQNEKMVDQTFVKLSNDEEVSAAFKFDEDLCKEFNRNKANIYTMIENYLPAAGNTMPLSEQTMVIPVGVKITTNGDYTFDIPAGTEGIGVTLIDNETGVRTSLSALDYTVNLSAGTYNERFLLEISPVQQTPTDLETVSDEGLEVSGARKVMIDQILYIVKDGKMYDARGARVE